MTIINTSKTIKSVRVFEENKIIKLDYYSKSNVKIPKGKVGSRFRFTTGEKATPMALKMIEKNKFSLAEEHFESLFQTLENKEIVLFEDIALIALEEAEANRKKVDGSRDYRNILKKDVLPFFGKIPIKDVKPKDIKAWLVEMGSCKLSQNRFNKKYYVLKRVLDFACENEYVESNPISYVKRSSNLFTKPKDKSNDYFSKDERKIILNDTCENGTQKDKLNHPFIHTFMQVALLTGARTGEISALKIEDIDFTNKAITFQRSIRKGVISGTKTGTIRVVPMIGDLQMSLEKYIGNSNRVYLFAQPTCDAPYSDTRTIVHQYYKPMLERLNLPYKILYNTRHSFASVVAELGVPTSIISKCLGHTTVSTTERFYLKFGNINQDDARNYLESLSA